MIAIAVERGEGDRRAEAVGQRNINARRSIDPSEAPRGQLNVAPEIIVRSAAGDVDRATDGVFAVERPLRSTQHLDLPRSEEHTSELQSLMRISYAVFCLKKKNKDVKYIIIT